MVSTKDVLQNIDVVAFHIGSGQINLNISSDKVLSNSNISLFDINGRIISSKQNVNLLEGENRIVLETQDLGIGTYIVTVENSLGRRSIKVSVR